MFTNALCCFGGRRRRTKCVLFLISIMRDGKEKVLVLASHIRGWFWSITPTWQCFPLSGMKNTQALKRVNPSSLLAFQNFPLKPARKKPESPTNRFFKLGNFKRRGLPIPGPRLWPDWNLQIIEVWETLEWLGKSFKAKPGKEGCWVSSSWPGIPPQINPCFKSILVFLLPFDYLSHFDLIFFFPGEAGLFFLVTCS